MAILKNKRGLRGEETTPVVCPYSFMNAVFNIEKKYGTDETFTIIKDGKPRNHLLHHLTNADLQLAITLLKTSNTNGRLSQPLARYNIYESLVDYFEKPIQSAAFYASFEKFKQHGLITETKSEHTGKHIYALNHYLDPETNKIGMYVTLPTLVFTEEFEEKFDVAHKKLFYSVYISQNEKYTEAPIKRNLNTDKDDIQFAGLYQFLHRKEPYQIRMILEELLTTEVQGVPLLSKAELLKDGRTYYQARLLINPGVFPKKEEKGGELHEPIPARLVYPRKANFIKKLLDEWKIGELVSYRNGKVFFDLIHILKNHGYRIIRYALYQIKKFYDEHARFPADIVQFIKNEVRTKTESSVISAACKMGVVDFITPLDGKVSRKDREFEFASSLSRYPIGIRQIEKMFALALPALKDAFGQPADVLRRSFYGIDHETMLEGDLGKVVTVARSSAYRLKKNPRLYNELEKNIVEIYLHEHQDGIDFSPFAEWAIRQVEELPAIEMVPVVPYDFKLEEFIVQRYLGQVY